MENVEKDLTLNEARKAADMDSPDSFDKGWTTGRKYMFNDILLMIQNELDEVAITPTYPDEQSNQGYDAALRFVHGLIKSHFSGV